MTFGHRPVAGAGCLRREYLGNDERRPALLLAGNIPGESLKSLKDFNGGGWPPSARGTARKTCRAKGAAISF